MNKNHIIFLVFTLILFSNLICIGQENLSTNSNITHKEATVFSGQLEQEEYKKIRKLIEAEFPIAIPKEHSILINFKQNENECHTMFDDSQKFAQSIKDSERISSRISSQNLTSDFFVFSPNIKHKEVIKMKENYSIDSGFFYNNIFTDHQTCSAFFILKTNGKFIKCYGEDYYSVVKTFLESK